VRVKNQIIQKRKRSHDKTHDKCEYIILLYCYYFALVVLHGGAGDHFHLNHLCAHHLHLLWCLLILHMLLRHLVLALLSLVLLLLHLLSCSDALAVVASDLGDGLATSDVALPGHAGRAEAAHGVNARHLLVTGEGTAEVNAAGLTDVLPASVGHHKRAMVLHYNAERVRIGFVVHTTHRLCVDVFEFDAQTHTLAVASEARGKVTAATVIAAAVTTRAAEQNVGRWSKV